MARQIVVCVPITGDGLLGPSWGRAERVGVATVGEGGIGDWQEFDVGWGELHEAGTEGSHHARIARFLLDHHVDAVAAHHMGSPMVNMLGRMGLTVQLGVSGMAKDVAVDLVGATPNPAGQ